MKKIIEDEEMLKEHPEKVKFLVKVNGQEDEIVAYADVLQYLE